MFIHPATEHRLDRLRIVLSLPPGDAERVSDACSRLFHQRLRALIAAVLDRAQQECGNLVVVEPLVLDLGVLPPSGFEQQLCQRLEPLLLQQLLHHRRQFVWDDDITMTEADADVDGDRQLDALAALNHYLEHGVWQTGFRQGAIRNGAWLLGLAAAHPQRWLPILAAHCLRPASLQRVRSLLQPADSLRLGRLMAPRDAPEAPPAAATLSLCALRYFQQHPLQAMPAVPQEGAILLSAPDADLLAVLFSAHATAPPPLAAWLRALWRQAAVFSVLQRHLAPDAWRRLHVWVGEGGNVQDTIIPTVGEDAAPSGSMKAPADRAPKMEADNVEAPADRARKVEADDVEAPVDRARKVGTDDVEAPVDRAPKVDVDDMATPDSIAVSANAIHGGFRTALRPLVYAITPESVSNAGICLLWPLLPGLWRQLEILDEKGFVDLQAQHNAACWLDELVWSDGIYIPDRLRLNKLLCGLSMNTPLRWTPPDSVTLVAMERCLAALPQQVPAWKNLRAPDIRQLFLQRPGWVLQDAGSCAIYIQPEPYDVLLDGCPWPTSMLILPWLPLPWSVHWQIPPGLPPEPIL
ncbi:contractile injection system tape measure protein [Burkholderia ubonensis]|uniref:contractile injection system tape measure protein n=1 Tax=Burkholderia ubonensis TaxID=101571 RepID=UPI0007529D7B|nr:contractile injection system tape measure protein [Burkholderia ubonensis]KVN29742.1 hypothetical protein WJ64_14915 [Burkholderia ubonensis]